MPAAKTERQRSNGRFSGSKRGQAMPAPSTSWADVPLTDEPAPFAVEGDAPERNYTSEAMPHGPSILKEIFPDHGKEEKTSQLTGPILDRLPSPSRNRARRAAMQGCSTPVRGAHMPMPPASPVMHRSPNASGGAHMPMPPASPMMHHSPNASGGGHMPMPPASPMMHHSPNVKSPNAHSSQPILGTPPPAPIFQVQESYRERLRRGGQGALQRSFDSGFMPGHMKQEWGAAQTGATYADGYMAQQSMDYGMAGDAQWQWGQEQWQGDDSWGGSQYHHMQMQDDYYQHQMAPQPQELLLPLEPGHMGPITPHAPCAQTPQMGPVTPHAQCPQTPQMLPMTPHGPDGSPSNLMAIVMPTQFPCDSDAMAAQLKAAADCQCYED